MNPEELARTASEGGELPDSDLPDGADPDGADPGADQADTPTAQAGSGSGRNVLKAFLHTEPSASPDDPEYQDTPAWLADFMIGTRKVLDYLDMDSGGGGVPAVVNFARGFWVLRQAQTDTADSGYAFEGESDL